MTETAPELPADPAATPDMTGHERTSASGVQDAPAEAPEQPGAEEQAPDGTAAEPGVEEEDPADRAWLKEYPPPTGPEYDLDPDMAAKVDELAPDPPPYVTPDHMPRWAMAARVSVMIALDQFPDDDDRALRQFAWSTARSIYGDPERFPLDEPGNVPAGAGAGTQAADNSG